MSPRIRKIKTGSGATAVQIVRKFRGKVTVLEHVGSAHTDVHLQALLAVGAERLSGMVPVDSLSRTWVRLRTVWSMLIVVAWWVHALGSSA